MAYENKTIDEVYNLLIEEYQEKFNRKLRLLPKSFIVVMAKVQAALYITLYKLAGWIYLQMFPDTASFKAVNILGHTVRPLVQLGKQFGVGEPETGTEWRGTVTVTAVTQGKALTLGTQLKSDLTGLVYNVSANTGIEAETVEVPVYCTQTGEAGNLSAGDVVKFVSPLGFVEREAVVSGTTQAGTDDETEEHYRNRVQTGYGSQPQGGSLTDYRTWSQGVAGVLQVYPYTDKGSPGGVLIYVAGDPDIYADRVADRGLCVAVGKACSYDPDTGLASRMPLGAVLDPAFDETYTNVKSVAVKAFDVYVTEVTGAVIADFGSSLVSELESYFLAREPFIRGLDDENARADTVRRNAVIAVVNGVATSLQAQFGTATIRTGGAETETYALGEGEVCKLGNLYINGVLYEA